MPITRQTLSRRAFTLHGLRYALAAGTIAETGRFASASPTGAPSTVRIVNTAGNTSLIFRELLEQRAFLNKYGVKATFISVSDGAKAVGALLSGSADICIGSGFAQVFPAVEAGAPLRLVAGAEFLAPVTIYSAHPEIQRVEQLAGRTIGIGAPGSLLHQLMVAILVKKGMRASDVQFVNIGSNSDVFRAVAAGKVDAGPGDFDLGEQHKEFKVHELQDGAMWSEIPEYTSQASFATVSAIQKQRESLCRVLAAYSDLYRFIQSPISKDAFTKAFAKVNGKGNASDANIRWSYYQKYKPLAPDLVISDDRIRYIQNLNVSLHVQKRILDSKDVADMSLAREALKLRS